MRWIALFALVASCLPHAASADVFGRALGVYGSLTDPEQSCAENPHRLDVTPRPPHVELTWDHAFFDRGGKPREHARYDILDADDTSITLRLEGDDQRQANGDRVIWILRLTEAPQGYCLGRSDWDPVRCVERAVRCDAPTS